MLKRLFGKLSGEVHGEGPAGTREDFTADFSAIKIAGPFALSWKQGQSCSWKAKMQENLFDYLDVKVQNGAIQISFTRSISLADIEKRPTIQITSPSINMLDMTGSVRAKDWDVVHCDTFKLNMAGSGRVDVELAAQKIVIDKAGSGAVVFSGSADSIAIATAGSGSINTLDVPARDVTISAAGSGQSEVDCSERLEVNLAGSGKIRYTGNPVVNQNIFGSGKVSRI